MTGWRPRALAFVLGLAALVAWLAVLTGPDGRLSVSFLDVGQGDAVFITTPSGRQVLVDGGPDAAAISLALGKRLAFWDRSIDLVVLTHPQDDHLLGLVEVLRRYQVGQVLEPGLEAETAAWREWERLVEEKDIRRTVARAGQTIDLGDGILIEVLHPGDELIEGESGANSNSVVLRLAWGEISFLLTGDIDWAAELDLLHGGKAAQSTVLKVAHHGSATSSGARFLAAVDPDAAVISVGADNDFGHPDAGTLARLEAVVDPASIYLTSDRGAITFTTDGERLWVKTER